MRLLSRRVFLLCVSALLAACATPVQKGPEFSVTTQPAERTAFSDSSYGVQSNTALRITVTNIGDQAATGVIATARSASPEVFMASPGIQVGALAVSESVSPKSLLALYVADGHILVASDLQWSFSYDHAKD